MSKFNREARKGGGAKRRGGFGGSRGFGGRSQMHPAVCNNCGRDCEVPFKPDGRKPIYCPDCFGREDGSERRPNRFGRRDNIRTSFSDRRFAEKRMFEADCDRCGNRCEVPFRPTGERTVYCKECFGGAKGAVGRGSEAAKVQGGITHEQFNQLNAKLDKIIRALNIVEVEAPKASAKTAEANKGRKDKKTNAESEVKKPENDELAIAKKPAKKKSAAKKPVSKKR